MSLAIDQKPWHRQPLVWMLIAIPASAVVAGFITLWLAISTDDGLVADDYYWQGKQINRTLARDRKAEQLGLAGHMSLAVNREHFAIELRANPDVDLPEALTMRFLHSTRAGHDQEIIVRHIGDGRYQGLSPSLALGGWHLQLGTEEWRLLGYLHWPAADVVEIQLTASEVGR